MENEEETSGAPRGLLLGLGLVGILVGAAIAGEFVLNLQPRLLTGPAAPGSVIMPQGVGSNTAFNFAPSSITVIIGQNNTVTFANKDIAIHTVTATDGSFNSGDIKPGGSWTHTFSAPGIISYYCIYHASWMRGKIMVKSGGPSGGGVTVNIPAGTGSSNTLNFSPSSITLVVGVNNTVTFMNQDSVVHTVTATDGSFDSQNISPGRSWSHTFAAGTYSFFCIYHSWMKGTIKVIP